MLEKVLEDLLHGNIQTALDNRAEINSIAIRILNTPMLTEEDKKELKLLIDIGNTSYDNYPNNILPIEDGVYDLLVIAMQNTDYCDFKVGSKPVNVNVPVLDSDIVQVTYPYIIPNKDDMEKLNHMLYSQIINYNKPMQLEDVMVKPFKIQPSAEYKRLRNTKHSYPELVGTLDKCKFVLDSQAIERGRYEDANVKIFERDFMAPLINSGIIDVYRPITMVGTLKYDGVSVEADTTYKIISARTRGDTDLDEATDLTPILQGYEFPRAKQLMFDHCIGMKFEAIITKLNLARLNELLGTRYINGRTAIIGLLGRLDAYTYRDYITLVPIQVDFANGTSLDRIEELYFLNRYFTTTEYIRYEVFEGTFNHIMYMIKKYVEEAEFARTYMPFMYDGVVLEFFDDNIRKALGRKNHINQYAMAIKFNPLNKQSIFRGYSYTIGKNGLITPMIYYDPVEFFGAIHNHSTGSSYKRFLNLDLHVGDIIDVEYTNDVMPYVTKPDNEHNRNNALKVSPELFPKYCPCCGTELVLSDSNKSARCPNIRCREAVKKRLSDSMDSLKLVGFSEEAVAALPNIGSFRDLMECSEEDLSPLGPTNKTTLYNMIRELKTTNIRKDSILMEALGFSNIAAKTWQSILTVIPLKQLYDLYISDPNKLSYMIVSIKNIGPVTANTIITEMEVYRDDIKYILDHNMYIATPRNISYKAVVRFSGIREATLEELLQSKGIDANGSSSVTRNTTLLLVPDLSTTGTKVNSAKKFGIPIVPIREFKLYLNEYLEKWDAL